MRIAFTSVKSTRSGIATVLDEDGEEQVVYFFDVPEH
jgi:hypothetical protein